MSAPNPRSNRRTDRDSGEQHPGQPGGGETVSTRVLIDSGTPPVCDACGETIELKARHKCLTVQDDGAVREFSLCDETCLTRKREQLQ